ncbi:hypothetical protein BraRD5C2_35840 [Bradyrhizobium sp. RD5-C2]|nr:hypothetical protein BraRD5C2_35840 [Bradyrhizobium sp. RD5-C2]
MSEHDRLVDAQVCKRVPEEIGLGRGGPYDIAGSQAVAEARAIKYDYAVVPGGKIDEATCFKILDHAAVAMKQNQWPAGPAFDIVQSDTIDFDEASLRRMIALGLVGKSLIDDRSGNHQADRRDSGGRHRIFPQSTNGADRQRWRTFFQ